MASRVTIAIAGPGDTTDIELLDVAERIGAAVARAGHALVTGGLDGVMAAASRGAQSAGGVVVGLLPGDRPDAANEWVDVAIPTGLGQGRNLLVARAGSVLVAVGGSWGTLSEVAFARRLGKPVVWVRGWHLDGPAPGDGVHATDDVDDAIALLLSLA